MPAPMRPVTMQVIADQVGFSKNTVSLALRGDSSISAATRELIRKTADKLGYQPNVIARSLLDRIP